MGMSDTADEATKIIKAEISREDAIVEECAAKVHEKWMDNKRIAGVTSRCSEVGEELMVPYTDLSEAAKELDRGSVRSTMKALADLGYSIEERQ